MISHIITPEQCATCRLCCQFTRASQWETPSLSPQQANSLRERGIPLMRREDGSATFALHYSAEDAEDACAPCPLLDPGRGCVLPRVERPIECRIWPLRLMRRKDGSLCIALYRNCPAICDEKAREDLIREATGPLLPFLQRMAEEIPAAVRPLHPAYDVIWTADAGSSKK